MKLLQKIAPVALIIFAMFFVVACEETADDVNPLVGSWAISNLAQTSTYTFADSSFFPFYSPGDTAGSGTLTWTEFSAMGVSGTVTMLEDNSFTLEGNFPIASDTLGTAPSIVPLTDGGTWTEGEVGGMPTLTIDGAFYDLGGVMTLSDDESMISLAYTSSSVDTMVIYVSAMQSYFTAPLTVVTSSELGFTRQ